MSYYFHLGIVIALIHVSSISTSSLRNRTLAWKNGTSLNLRHRISEQAGKFRHAASSVRDRYEHARDDHDDEPADQSTTPTAATSVVVVTSLSGIYVWWPIIFGGDDSFHLLLTQEDVPRFHDVAGDDRGNIYLTAPHERTVYCLQYVDGWWISTFSNHSVMNSIRSEMPLFVNVHYVSSILYVYGHSDIQIIDLLQKPRARGSAPFMRRLRELSPSLRISDMIIDQVTSDGYIIGDSYGWCTVIRCSLNVNDCTFLFKIPSSYDNRPYPCIATVDFSTKIMYVSLEEKVLAVHLNEHTQYDRREVLAEKRGARSTLGYDDIVVHQSTLLYTDVLRPLLHVCLLANSDPCLNMSLTFPPPQRPILPLRLSIVQVSNLRPPVVDDEDEIELHINQSTPIPSTAAQLAANHTDPPTKPRVNRDASGGNIWMLILGICIGLLVAGISFMIYYVIWNKNRPRLKKEPIAAGLKPSSQGRKPLLIDEPKPPSRPRYQPMTSQSTIDRSPISASDSLTETSSELTTTTTSSSSYRPNTIL